MYALTLMWAVFVYHFAEISASADHVLSGDESDSINSPSFVESEDPDSMPKIQFKKAEIADAVMGTKAPINPSAIEALFPKQVKDPQSGFSPPCDGSSDQCAHPDDEESPEEMNSASSQQVTDQEPYMIFIFYDC